MAAIAVGKGMDERQAVMKSDCDFIGRIGLVCQPIARIAKQSGEALADFMVGHANVFSRSFDTIRPTSKSVPTENSVCPSTIRQSPCGIVTFGVVPDGRTVGSVDLDVVDAYALRLRYHFGEPRVGTEGSLQRRTALLERCRRLAPVANDVPVRTVKSR